MILPHRANPRGCDFRERQLAQEPRSFLRKFIFYNRNDGANSPAERG
jgi:hypothetical protein